MGQGVIRIADVRAAPGKVLHVTWRDGAFSRSAISLDGWIASGGAGLAALERPEVFALAALGDHGASVTWDEGEGDLSIDAHHLRLIAEEQSPFGGAEITLWQKTLALSNREAAGLIGVGMSTWATYKAGTAPIPHAVRLLCRSILRDPLTLHAWLRPARAPGRPGRTTRAA